MFCRDAGVQASSRVGALNWLLLVRVEAVGEQRVVGGHYHLKRLKHPLKVINAMEQLMQRGILAILRSRPRLDARQFIL